MRCFYILLASILLTTTAYAEDWICFDSGDKHINRTVNGDGLRLGISGINNSNIDPDCILAVAPEFTNAKLAFKKVDTGLALGSRVIDWTQPEIDTFTQAQADAQTASNRQGAKDFHDVTAMKAFIKILIDEINILRANDGLGNRTIIQLRNSINAEIDSGNSD